MKLADDEEMLVKDLENQLGFSHPLAVAFVRAKGRCEYCGTDLLMSRQEGKKQTKRGQIYFPV